VGLTARLDGYGEEKFSCPHQGSNPRPSAQSKVPNYVTWTTTAYTVNSLIYLQLFL